MLLTVEKEMIYSHGIGVASGGTKELVVPFDAGNAAYDFAPNVKAQGQWQCRPPNLQMNRKRISNEGEIEISRDSVHFGWFN